MGKIKLTTEGFVAGKTYKLRTLREICKLFGLPNYEFKPGGGSSEVIALNAALKAAQILVALPSTYFQLLRANFAEVLIYNVSSVHYLTGEFRPTDPSQNTHTTGSLGFNIYPFMIKDDAEVDDVSLQNGITKLICKRNKGRFLTIGKEYPLIRHIFDGGGQILITTIDDKDQSIRVKLKNFKIKKIKKDEAKCIVQKTSKEA